MTWRPINPAHAIERVRFVMKFGQSVPAKIARQMSESIAKQSNETRLEGPQEISAVNIGFHVAPDGKPIITTPTAKVPGWQFARLSSNGLPLEIVALEDDKVIYETTSYRRWETFMQRFDRVVAPVVALGVQSLDVDLVSIEYFDRFLFDGPRQKALPADLLVGIDNILHPDAASGRTMWHYHRGWFEQSGVGDVLVNQNIDAVDTAQPETGEPVRTINLLTKAEARSANCNVDGTPIVDLLDSLHEVTKRYFVQAVQPSMLNSVGIQ